MTNPLDPSGIGVDPEVSLQHKLNLLYIDPTMSDDQMRSVGEAGVAAKARFAKAITAKKTWQAYQTAYDGFVAAIKGLDKTYCAQQFNCTTDFVLQVLQTLIDRNAQKVAGFKATYDASVQPPVAVFNAVPTGLVVAFTDTTVGSPYAWAWDFGDGSTDTAESPQHTYAAAGTYTVSLTVTNAVTTNTVTQQVTVS